MRGSTSSVRSMPLTVIRTCMSDPSLRAGGGAVQRPPRELVCQVPLVDHWPALIGAGIGAGGGDPAGLGDRVVAENLSAQVVLGLRYAGVLGAQRGDADADIGHPIAVEH